MESRFRDSFLRDISGIRNPGMLALIHEAITNVETGKSILEVRNLKKLKGSRIAFRIKAKEYRIGIFIENGVVEFTRCLHRREIYKYFPQGKSRRS